VHLNRSTVLSFIIAASLCLIGTCSQPISAQQTKSLFTVADDIGVTLFGNEEQALRFSPDGSYFVIWTERGLLDLNRVQDSLRFYRSGDVEKFLEHSAESQPPSPIWVVNRSGSKGPVIRQWRWLLNSRGVAFLEPTGRGNQRLVLADLRKKTIEPLTSSLEMVKAFDIRDRQHYIYTVSDLSEREERLAERQAAAIVGTGRTLFELLRAGNPLTVHDYSPRSYLWAVVGGGRFEVKQGGAPLVLSGGDLALSPDSRSLVTTWVLPEVPSSWETLYPSSPPSYSHRVRAGRQDLLALPTNPMRQYVRISLQSGSVQSLTDAPLAESAGWWVRGSPTWSSDGRAILLPGTFLSSKDHAPSRPCVAVVDLPSNTRTCVEMLKGQTETGVEEGYHQIVGARFVEGDKRRIRVSFFNRDYTSSGATEYQRTVEGPWQVAEQVKGMPEVGQVGFKVSVQQGLNEPPLLVATGKQVSRVIWDPNPQLKNIELGQASVYRWKDKEGRDWKGGLYKPINYKPGQRYPLVIQPEGFEETLFRPSGSLPTAFAARELAAAGIAVLQVAEGCHSFANEGQCYAGGFESGVSQLVSEGLVDPEKVGMIGFLRNCFYVMDTLTRGSLHIKAASITDGTLESYFQYMTTVDFAGNGIAHEFDLMIGAPPFGEGLQLWVKRSSSFNLDKITSPLLIVAKNDPIGLLFMWEPYAGLRYLHKAVDLIMLNTDEHIPTNPATRLASQGGSVDWFRFWLRDYEDPCPAKAQQYARWRELRKLQQENDAKDKAANGKPAPVN
jgi:hypothetical protein